MALFRFAQTGVFICMVLIVSAQNEERYLPAWELGISTGAYVYQGDLTPYKIGSFKTITPGLQVTAGKYITDDLFLRTGLAVAYLKGNDRLYSNKQEYRYYRNYTFKSYLAELHAIALAYVFNSGFYEQKVKPYLAGGAAFVFINARSSSAATDFSYFLNSDLPVRLAADQQKSNSRVLPAVMAGAGIQYDINASIAFTGEALYRFGFSDYIDGFSIAANQQENDQYYSISFGIVFKFHDNGLSRSERKKLRCRL